MEFIKKITHGANRQDAIIDYLRSSSLNVVIYGAGVYSYVLYKYLTAKGIRIKNFYVDKKYLKATSYLGLEVHSVEDNLDFLKNECNIVLGVTNYPKTIDQFAKLDITNISVIDVPDFLNIPSDFMDYKFVKRNDTAFLESYNSLNDNLSKETFIGAINSKINGDVSYIKPFVEMDHLYFSSKAFKITPDEVLLDVGGYDGDSISDFRDIVSNKYKRIISLEPFKENFLKLKKSVLDMGLHNTTLLQIGAWSKKDTLSFMQTEGNIDNKISDDGNAKMKINVNTIDSIVQSQGINDISFIKMDINGAEYEALKGAKMTIHSHRPKIAVKLHVKDDFFRLPLLLKKIAPDINIIIRQRNYMSMMLVLYAFFNEDTSTGSTKC